MPAAPRCLQLFGRASTRSLACAILLVGLACTDQTDSPPTARPTIAVVHGSEATEPLGTNLARHAGIWEGEYLHLDATARSSRVISATCLYDFFVRYLLAKAI